MNRYEEDLEELLETTEEELKIVKKEKQNYLSVLTEACRILGILNYQMLPGEIRKLKGKINVC